MKLENKTMRYTISKNETISNFKHIESDHDNLTDWYQATNNIETDFKYKNTCHDNRRLVINRRNDPITGWLNLISIPSICKVILVDNNSNTVMNITIYARIEVIKK